MHFDFYFFQSNEYSKKYLNKRMLLQLQKVQFKLNSPPFFELDRARNTLHLDLEERREYHGHFPTTISTSLLYCHFTENIVPNNSPWTELYIYIYRVTFNP